MTVDFLTKEDVLDIHRDQINRCGGAAGLRDEGLLESALAQPAASFDGVALCEDLASMAASYLFHIANNHPFIDGNKRTSLARRTMERIELRVATRSPP